MINSEPLWEHVFYKTILIFQLIVCMKCTAWKVSKYGVISGPYFPVFGLNTEIYEISVFNPNTGKYGPEINSYWDSFHAVVGAKSKSALIIWCSGAAIERRSYEKCSYEKCSENIQQIYRRTAMPKCDFNKVALQLYWNHTSAWVFPCKFAACFQNTFS